MKIMSLNVNQFRVLRLSKGCWAKEIVEFAKKFLSEDKDNAVFLYEVPYYAGFGSKYYGILELFQDFKNEFPSDLYRVEHSSDRKAYFCTLAIVNKKSDWGLMKGEKRFSVKGDHGEEIQQNRFIELAFKKEDENKRLQVLSVHASLDQNFLSSLADYVKMVFSEEGDHSRFIVLGDLNCHMGEESSHKPYLKEMMYYLHDLIEDGIITYFPGKTTVDHVLISEKLEGKVVAQVIPQVVLELSDHAVIIVNVEE